MAPRSAAVYRPAEVGGDPPGLEIVHQVFDNETCSGSAVCGQVNHLGSEGIEAACQARDHGKLGERVAGHNLPNDGAGFAVVEIVATDLR